MSRTYRSSEQTRANILRHAVALFNERGTDDVSTNTIAAAAAISAGNLYYHFGNKEEIIRAILEQMILEWNGLYEPLDPDAFGLDALRRLLHDSFALTWRYRFFFRELVALLRRDEALQERYHATQARRIADQNAFITRLADQPGARPAGDPAEITNALRIAWILGDTWLLHIEALGQPVDESSLQEGVALILQVLRPVLPLAGSQ